MPASPRAMASAYGLQPSKPHWPHWVCGSSRSRRSTRSGRGPLMSWTLQSPGAGARLHARRGARDDRRGCRWSGRSRTARAASPIRSAHRHSGLRAFVDVQQGQRAAIEAGRQDHALADAEAHLARGQVGDEHDVAADQPLRLAIAGADAGEDLALAELAGVEQEAQQLVRAVDEAAFEHLADAQVEPGEIVD